ncbi:mitochondrial import inner membrane translocase subunit TIM44-like [Mercenaria mercenaria]|uniref:mitochondrial import inner membrane translocase subunit TIM44-like n=1 Tax=Mercenaria mercenaria TaxID=6596 RepID=UPI00234F49C0|nr:mitochondrial import inner membrane translocase subunit TIM44-like [Mercenaria mercenaria]
MASMWRVTPKNFHSRESTKILYQIFCRECSYNRQVTAASCVVCKPWRHQDSFTCQVRSYSDGRKGFFENIYENLKEGFSKDKHLNENLKKFRQEKEKLESSDAIKKARQKFENIGMESDTTETFKKGIKDVKSKVSETLEEVQKSDFVKKGMEVTGELGKTVGKAGETVIEQGKKLGESATVQTVSKGVKAVKKEFDETALSKAKHYKPPEKLRMRSDRLDPSERDSRIFEPDNETVGVVLHKDSKWHESWQNFKDNNEFVNKVFDLKMKYDESDNIVVRGTRFFTDKISSLFGGMFSKTEMSEVLTEVCKMDPDFEPEKFVRWCQYDVIPNLLEAMAHGEEEVLKDWCYEAPFNVLMHPIKTAKSNGLRIDNKILDVSNVDIAAGKMMEQGPVLVISFNAQQTMVVRNAKGEVVEGDDDKIMWVTYVWALCRDMEELNPDAAWKLLDISMHSQEQWL